MKVEIGEIAIRDRRGSYKVDGFLIGELGVNPYQSGWTACHLASGWRFGRVVRSECLFTLLRAVQRIDAAGLDWRISKDGKHPDRKAFQKTGEFTNRVFAEMGLRDE